MKYRNPARNIILTLLTLSLSSLIAAENLLDPANGGTITYVNSEANNSSLAAANLVDNNFNSYWQSPSYMFGNDVIFNFGAGSPLMCFDEFSVTGINSSTGLETFMLLTTNDIGLDQDNGTVGWTPVVADQTPSGVINHLHWGQGGRFVSAPGSNPSRIHDGSPGNYWQSSSYAFGNTLEFGFDSDWNDAIGNAVRISELSLYNRNSSTDVEKFQVEVKTLSNSNWTKLISSAAPSGDFNYLQSSEGGTLTTSVGSNPARIHDGTPGNYWQSASYAFNNTLSFEFDVDTDGVSGAAGDGDDLFSVRQLNLFNRNSSTDVEKFQVEVRTLANNNWTKLIANPAPPGDFNFLLESEGGVLTASVGTNPARIHDGTPGNYWQSASYAFVNELDFAFDVDADGTTSANGDSDDLFTLRQLNLFNRNSSTDVELFQVEVKTLSNGNWSKLVASAAPVGDFNFLQATEGGTLTASVGSNPNRIHDGTPGNYWQSASYAFVNTLEFDFDVDDDGTSGAGGDSDDLFSLRQFNLYNRNSSTDVEKFQVEVKTLANSNWTKLVSSVAPVGDFNFLQATEGGTLTASVGSNPNRIHDSTPGNYWQSASYVFNNSLAFSFDNDADGTTGAQGDSDDLFSLRQINLYNRNSSTDVEKFQVEVKTLANSNWNKLVSATTPTGDFNFLQATEGGTITASVGSNPDRIHDGTPGNFWQSASNSFVNQIDFAFDKDMDGSTGSSGDNDDLFTLREINLYNRNSSTDVQTFEVEVRTQANPVWSLVSFSGSTTLTALRNSSKQSFVADVAMVDVIEFRLRTLSNYGNTVTRISEIEVIGDATGASHTFTALRNASKQSFVLEAAVADVTELRLITLDNYGNTVTRIAEFEAIGDAVNPSHTFTALRNANKQSFVLDSAVADVTELRLITLDNYGNTVTRIAEFEAIGDAVGPSHTFKALRSASQQSFVLDTPTVDVTELRLITLDNYGNTVTRIAEFEAIGDAVSDSHTFTALRSASKQSYVLDTPVADVTELRLITLDNYGNTVTRIAEFEVIGDAVGPSHTFIAQRTAAKQTFNLGLAVDNVTDVRLITLDNYGNTVTRIAEFGVEGTTTGPAYVFTAQRSDAVQQYSFDGGSGRLFRFHTFDNYGNTVTRTREIALESTLCLAGSWSMDEITWSGASDEIIDTSGNGHHGTAVNGTVPGSTLSAIPGNPGTCGYGEFDGSNDYVALNNFPNLTGSFTITAWIRANSFRDDQRIFVDDENNSGGFAFSLGDGGRSRLRFFSRNVSPVIVDTQTPVIRFDDQWYFVTAVHNAEAKTREIYVDGVAERLNTGGFISTYTGNWGEDNGPASIGGETNGAGSEATSNWRFGGDIDEVRVYQQALDQTEIQAVMAETHPCGAGIDHFLISHDGQGISCSAEPVTVSAHALDHSVFIGYASNIVLDTGSGNGSWSLVSGNGSFNDATADDGLASYQFDASDNGVAQFALDYQQGTSPINITVGDGSVLDDDTEELLNFSPSGFIVTASQVSNPPPNPINDPVGSQTAGTDFSMWITAFGQTATDPSCGVIESYSGVKPINFWNNTINPNTGTLTPTVAGSSIAASEGASAAQNITFNNGQAQITVKYKDVGQIRIDLKDADLINKANVITGSSNNFVVKPADFVLSVSGNPAAADANGAVFKKAGEAFQADVSVVDAEGSVTPNFGNETSPESIKVKSSQLIAPIGGRNGSAANGTLNNGNAFTATAPGQFSNTTVAFDEVGIIRLQADVNDEDYLGSGNVTGAETGNVGRFIPDRFLVSDNSPQFRNGDSAWTCGFSYQQQPFQFDAGLNPILDITAVNQAGAPTFNYGAAFWKLTTNATNRSYVNQAAGIDAILATDTSSSTVTLSGTADLSDGLAQLTIADDSLQYLKAASTPTVNDAPFNADAVLNLTVADLQDADGVCYDSDNDGNCDEYQSSNITGTEIRWGRWSTQNAFGSELEDLTLIGIAEQFNGTVFQVNTSDVCSASVASWITPTLSVYTENLSDGETVLSQSAMASGIVPFSLSAPGEGNYGSTLITIPTPNWMYYDFDGDGSADAASATATFGIFKGKSPVIYWRQKYSN